jgi:hypothetical protein
MRTNSRYQTNDRYRNYNSWFRVTVVLILIFFHTGAKSEYHQNAQVTWHFPLMTSGCFFSIDLYGIDKLIGINSLVHEGQLLKQRASHPLSTTNFNKTRPRGIPAQEPTAKFNILSGQILIFPLDGSLFIVSNPFHFLSLTVGKTFKIRPPPCYITRDDGFSA